MQLIIKINLKKSIFVMYPERQTTFVALVKEISYLNICSPVLTRTRNRINNTFRERSVFFEASYRISNMQATFPPKIPTRGLRRARQLWHSVHPVFQTFHLLMLFGISSCIEGSVSSIIRNWIPFIMIESLQANTGIPSQSRQLQPPFICLPIHYLPIILLASLLTASLKNHKCK